MCSADWQLARRRKIAYGRWPAASNRHPVQPVVEHLNALRDAGMPGERVAAAAGVSHRWVQTIRNDNRKWVDAAKAAQVLAIPLPTPATVMDVAAAGAHIDATGTRRRAQALSRLGYNQRQVGERLGMSFAVGYRIWSPGQRNVEARTARRMAALYDELSVLPPPTGWQADRTRRHAVSKGWQPPLAWDDDTIDDPNAQPAQWERTDEQFPPDWFDEVVDQLVVGRRTPAQVAEYFDVQLDSLQQRLRRIKPVGTTTDEIIAAGGIPPHMVADDDLEEAS